MVASSVVSGGMDDDVGTLLGWAVASAILIISAAYNDNQPRF